MQLFDKLSDYLLYYILTQVVFLTTTATFNKDRSSFVYFENTKTL